ncbi:uncharacterized protein TNIN_10881 [Trichonephila inaurata madagascariensis]|uniref:Uncharacterized protein n=1 Tax=Trichonephila inaurata madagascariensis TaxID=2747483 RepID=A0A8X6XKF0_9ARAC|nr:uncharacterized protein TNIN_10881 [Trichonephila inaurata madagascariensis]
MKPENAVKGFKGSGLYPLNRKAIQHRILILDNGNNQEHIVQEWILPQPLYLLKLYVAQLTFKRFKESNNTNSLSHPICRNILAIENSKRKRKRVQSKRKCFGKISC